MPRKLNRENQLTIGLSNSGEKNQKFPELQSCSSFEVILYITIFAFLSPGNCFKSAIGIQNLLESDTG